MWKCEELPLILCGEVWIFFVAAHFSLSHALTVIRDNLLLSSKAHEWRRTIDEIQGNPTITTQRETMSSMQASAVSGGTTGMILSCVICKLSTWKFSSVIYIFLTEQDRRTCYLTMSMHRLKEEITVYILAKWRTLVSITMDFHSKVSFMREACIWFFCVVSFIVGWKKILKFLSFLPLSILSFFRLLSFFLSLFLSA